MIDQAAELTQELKVLRRGRGLQARQTGQQFGPLLREISGITEHDDSESIHNKVRSHLTRLADRLPDDVRFTVKSALGLESGISGDFLSERIQALAEQQNKDTRTIRRHLDAGIEELVTIALETSKSTTRRATGEWHLHHFDAILLMNRNSPECFERRTIIADQDGLDEVSASITIPSATADQSPDHNLLVEPYFGVRLESVERPSSTRFLFRFTLPHTLLAGETHEFGLITRLPPGQPMKPYYVFFPGRYCAKFDLRICFDPKQRPHDIRRVDNVFYPDLDDRVEIGEPIALDRAGEVRLSFQDLMLGYGYGARWQ